MGELGVKRAGAAILFGDGLACLYAVAAVLLYIYRSLATVPSFLVILTSLLLYLMGLVLLWGLTHWSRYLLSHKEIGAYTKAMEGINGLVKMSAIALPIIVGVAVFLGIR